MSNSYIIKLLLCVGLSGAFICVSSNVFAWNEPEPEYSVEVAGLLYDISSDRIFNFLTDIEGFDTRYSYSYDLDDSIDYIFNKFDGFGYNVYFDPLPGGEINDVFALDGTDKAWVVAEQGMVFATNDGGATWNQIDVGLNTNLNAVYFPDEVTGFIVGDDGILLKSVDGGETFTIIDTLNTVNNLSDVYFVDDSVGWVTSRRGRIYRTIDGGDEWEYAILPGGITPNSICFIDDQNGWACGDNGVVIYSDDGGYLWETQVTNIGENLNAIIALDENTLVALGESGKIIKSDSAGSYWYSANSGTSNNLNDICFVNIEEGFAVGDYGTFLFSDDGGYHWSETETNTVADLNAVSFVGEDAGYLVGDFKCLYTNDAGTSFLELTNFDRAWRNIIAEKSGLWLPDEVVILCVHYDSISEIPYEFAPGANADAAGVAVALAVAEALKDIKLQRTVRIICFAGGEQDEVGSLHYVESAARNDEEIVSIIDVNLPGYSEATKTSSPNSNIFIHSDNDSSVLADYTAQCNLLYGVGATITQIADSTITCSDFARFSTAGHTSVLLTEAQIPSGGDFPNPYYRTIEDTSDKLDRQLLQKHARISTAAIYHLGRKYTQGMIGEPYPYDKIKVYPNPARIPADNWITFTDILPPFTLDIYSISGDKIRHFEVNDGISIRWDLKNDDGVYVAAGVYLYRLKSQLRTETGKIAVIK